MLIYVYSFYEKTDAENLQSSFFMAGWGDSSGEGMVIFNDMLYTYDGKPGMGEGNRGHYSNAEVDALLDQASVETDQAKRAALLLGVVAIKLTAPDTLEPYRQRLLTLMGGDTDFTAAFSAVGHAFDGSLTAALDDAYTAVFGPRQAQPTAATYTAENTPEDVCLTQQVLGFAYAAPVQGTVTDGFGWRENAFHYGTDIAAGCQIRLQHIQIEVVVGGLVAPRHGAGIPVVIRRGQIHLRHLRPPPCSAAWPPDAAPWPPDR